MPQSRTVLEMMPGFYGFSPFEGIWILESGKFLPMESGMENFACGIQDPALWNPEYSSRNPEFHL